MPIDRIFTHPVILETRDARHAYLQALADSLVRNIDDPDTFTIAAKALCMAGLEEYDAAAKIGLSPNRLRLLQSDIRTLDDNTRRKFIEAAIQLLCEQLPHPPEGF